MQIVMAMDVDQRTELQTMILDLEEENRYNLYSVVIRLQCSNFNYLLLMKSGQTLEERRGRMKQFEVAIRQA